MDQFLTNEPFLIPPPLFLHALPIKGHHTKDCLLLYPLNSFIIRHSPQNNSTAAPHLFTLIENVAQTDFYCPVTAFKMDVHFRNGGRDKNIPKNPKQVDKKS